MSTAIKNIWYLVKLWHHLPALLCIFVRRSSPGTRLVRLNMSCSSWQRIWGSWTRASRHALLICELGTMCRGISMRTCLHTERCPFLSHTSPPEIRMVRLLVGYCFESKLHYDRNKPDKSRTHRSQPFSSPGKLHLASPRLPAQHPLYLF